MNTTLLFMLIITTLAIGYQPLEDYYIPMDAQLSESGEQLYVIYNDMVNNIPLKGFLGSFKWWDWEWIYQGTLYEDLCFPHTLNLTLNNSFLISDTNNDRVLVVDYQGEVIWDSQDYGISVKYANDAELSFDGKKVLICDNRQMIHPPGLIKEIEINPKGKTRIQEIKITKKPARLLEVDIVSGEVIWEYVADHEWQIHDCDYLANGNILFCESSAKRCREIDREGNTVWEHENENWGWLRSSERRNDGNTLMADKTNIYCITPDHQEIKILSFPMDESLFNIHDTLWGILVTVCGTKRVCLINNGQIIWEVKLPTTDKTENFTSWRDLKELGYIE